jgi:hypothetical protein
LNEEKKKQKVKYDNEKQKLDLLLDEKIKNEKK